MDSALGRRPSSRSSCASSVEPVRLSRSGVPIGRLRPPRLRPLRRVRRPLPPVAMRRMARLAVRRLARCFPMHPRRAVPLAAFAGRAPLVPLARRLPLRRWRCRLSLIRRTPHPMPRRRNLLGQLLPPCRRLRRRRHRRKYHGPALLLHALLHALLRRRRRLEQHATATGGPALEALPSLQVHRRRLGGPILGGDRRAPRAADVVSHSAESRHQHCRGESGHDGLGGRPLGRCVLGCVLCAAHRKRRGRR